MPRETQFCNPSGLPTASTSCPARKSSESPKTSVGKARELDAELLRTAHDVRVGDDVAVRIDDHAGPGRALRRDEIRRARDQTLAGGVCGTTFSVHRTAHSVRATAARRPR